MMLPLAYNYYKQCRFSYTIVASMADTIAALGTESISETVNTNTRSHVEMAGNSSYT